VRRLLVVLVAALAACGVDGPAPSGDTAMRPAPAVSSGPTSTPTTVTEPDGDPGEGAAVIDVVDGDTIVVRVDGGTERVRLIGINTPERGECLAGEATRFLADLVGRGPVRLEADVSDRDRFDRLLRHVHVGDRWANLELVEAGLAIARRYPPDTRRADELDAAQQRARRAGVGIWDPTACGPAPGGAVRAQLSVSDLNPDAPGDDNQNLNGEWIELRNDGPAPAELTGWMVRDESATHRFRFPDGFTLAPGARVRIFTGCGTPSATALYWCSQGSAVWNNSGDTVFVLDPAGNVVVSRSY
jgi:micrococcal nuclease